MHDHKAEHAAYVEVTPGKWEYEGWRLWGPVALGSTSYGSSLGAHVVKVITSRQVLLCCYGMGGGGGGNLWGTHSFWG